jgi:hypothetical protein
LLSASAIISVIVVFIAADDDVDVVVVVMKADNDDDEDASTPETQARLDAASGLDRACAAAATVTLTRLKDRSPKRRAARTNNILFSVVFVKHVVGKL